MIPLVGVISGLSPGAVRGGRRDGGFGRRFLAEYREACLSALYELLRWIRGFGSLLECFFSGRTATVPGSVRSALAAVFFVAGIHHGVCVPGPLPARAGTLGDPVEVFPLGCGPGTVVISACRLRIAVRSALAGWVFSSVRTAFRAGLFCSAQPLVAVVRQRLCPPGTFADQARSSRWCRLTRAARRPVRILRVVGFALHFVENFR